MAKTKFEMISIFDGEIDATDAFIEMILENVISKKQDMLSISQQPCYTKTEVPIFQNLASGLCG